MDIIFSLYGFNNALVFKNIENCHLDEITKLVREDPDVLFNVAENLDTIFGKTLAADLTKFQFRLGDRMLILELVAYVKNKISTHGLQFFQSRPASENKNQAERAESDDTKSEDAKSQQNGTMKNTETKAQFFLNRLLANAIRNGCRKKGGHRYDDVDKLFASYLRMIIGPMAYETLYRNLEGALPSLSSANRYIRASNCHVTEGILRCEELSIYLKERKQSPIVCLAEDGTRMVGKVQYDSISNQLVGFVLPTNTETGMPIPFAYPARNATEIVNHFLNENAVASFLNVIMAQPLDGAPPFCLLLFGSDNRYTASDVKKRWNCITTELKRLGISVLTISSDSDPKYNSAMRELSTLGMRNNDLKWYSCALENEPPFYVQDTIHIATKMRNFLLRLLRKSSNKHQFPFGKYHIRLQHLYELIKRFPKQHGLTASTLSPHDRQNFASVERMYDQRVIDLLRNNVNGSQGTIQFLQIIRDVVGSYMERNLTPLQRVRKIWYSLFLIRIWREFIMDRKNATLKDNFLSLNCYACIELNAHSMVKCILYLEKIGKPELFQPYLYESQTCESIFRQFRSMSSTNSTVTNCTVKEANARISKIQFQNEIIQTTSSDFIFPRLKKKCTEANDDCSLPTAEQIYNEIILCEKSAIATAIKLGLVNKGTAARAKFVCKINAHTTSNDRVMKTSLHSTLTSKKESYILPDLKNVQLKDYTGKYKHKIINEKSPYVEMNNAAGKGILVRKTSLCWLLREDSQKLSSDRLERVKYYTKKKSTVTHTLKKKYQTKHFDVHQILKQRTRPVRIIKK